MLSFLDEEEATEVLRVVEKDACFLSSVGRLTQPDAMHSGRQTRQSYSISRILSHTLCVYLLELPCTPGILLPKLY